MEDYRARLIKVKTSSNTNCHDHSGEAESKSSTGSSPVSQDVKCAGGAGGHVSLGSLANKRTSSRKNLLQHGNRRKTHPAQVSTKGEERRNIPHMQSFTDSAVADLESEQNCSTAQNLGFDDDEDSLWEGTSDPFHLPSQQRCQSECGEDEGVHYRGGMSITPVMDDIEQSIEQEIPDRMSEEEVSLILEWFRETFAMIGKHGRVTLKDFKHAAKESELFAEYLFKLFDTDHSDSVSLQELVGGLGRLTTSGKKVKILEWFEQTFAHVSGEDQLLQIDEFKRALQIKGFLEKFYQLMDNDNNGRITIPQLIDAFQKLTCLDRDAKWLAWFEQQFSSFAGSDRQIDLEEFKRALHVKQSFFAERFFQLFDQVNSGYISLKELMDGLTLLTNGTEVDKLRFLFQVYDVDGNGFIDFEELRTVLKSCMDESALQLSDSNIDQLTRALFEDADVDKSGTITFEELQAELDKHPGVIENLTISAANWLKPPSSQRHRSIPFPHWMTPRFMRNNLAWVIWLGIYFVINIILFVEAAVRYKDSGAAVAIARGCGQCLNFNPTFIIILMMRRALTWLRSTRIAFLFPLDQHIELHKLCGTMILIYSLVHTLAHLINLTLLSLTPDGLPLWMYFFGVNTGLGWVGGTAGLTGDLLLIILLILVLCSLPCVRKKGFFEVFYWTHNLFFLWYILLILHGGDFWKWFLVPAILYILERILRSKWVKLARYGRTYIQEGILLPSKVTHLVMNRPFNFDYQPGDYVFVQIPSIAKYEWHPFTISSAPEQQGFIWLHIRSVGTWTNKLYEFFDERNRSKKRETLQLQLPRDQQTNNVQELEETYINLDDTSYDGFEVLENEIHPLAIVDQPPDSRQDETASLITHGQDFSHLYSQPTVINVQIDNEEEKGIEVHIDGPYGTPSTHIFQAEHAVLVGAGIGVTPFASILQSVMMRYRNARQVCPRCNHGWTGDIPSSVMRLKKVDFFWINRDQKSFEWFVSLLSQLEIEQSEQCGFERFLDLYMYMTSALRKTDVKAIGLQMALDLIHKKEKRDLITGLKTRTQAGRPDWEKVFRQLDNDRKGKVTVFFCGPPAISNILKRKCAQYNFEFRKENF